MSKSLDKQLNVRKPKDTSKRLNNQDRSRLLNFVTSEGIPGDGSLKILHDAAEVLSKKIFTHFTNTVKKSDIATLLKFQLLEIPDRFLYSDGVFVDVFTSRLFTKQLEAYREKKTALQYSKNMTLAIKLGLPLQMKGLNHYKSDITPLFSLSKDLGKELIDVSGKESNYHKAHLRMVQDFEQSLSLCKTFDEACELWSGFKKMSSVISPISKKQQLMVISPDSYNRINKVSLKEKHV